ncbi:FecR family protein [Butyrivibrio sp. ob235]|uniref:InlB B-repeat-containing protein n=1 Tax=Butyrivibrio sp. ob235 TaxID=1761780 RepID=UPI0008BE71AF|nr:FecR domain-containing protein [Butyrivibrio sp. ob235]SEL64621.1 FecR family protein [Butyrivibrio sp. ob235]
MKSTGERILVFAMCLSIAMTAIFAGHKVMAEEAVASTIRMTKTEGEVKVTDSSGTELKTTDNMRLFNGNHVGTDKASYAYFNLDDKKAVKLDAISETEIHKKGDNLEVLVLSGNMYFNVSEKLKSGQNVNVRTSNMVMGIRGTIIQTRQNGDTTEIVFIDGNGEGETSDGQHIEAGPGEKVTVQGDQDGSVKINTDKATIEDLGGFVWIEIANDPDARDKAEGAGFDTEGVTPESAKDRQNKEEQANSDLQDKVNKNKEDQDNNSNNDAYWGGNSTQGQTGTGTNPPPQAVTPQGQGNTVQPETPQEPATPENTNPVVEQPSEEDPPAENNDGESQQKKKYKITLNFDSDDGKVKSTVSEAEEGKSVTIKVSPKDGYKVKSVSSKQVDLEEDDGKYTFDMPAKDVTITVKFEKVEEDTPQPEPEPEPTKYTVTTECDTSQGSISISPSGELTAGTSVTATAVPNEGYSFDSMTITNTSDNSAVTASGDGNTKSFTMPEGNVKVSATFKLNTYDIATSVSGADASFVSVLVNGEAATSAAYGQKVTVRVKMNDNYYPKTISVNGNSETATYVSANTGEEPWTLDYEFTMGTANAQVDVTYVTPTAITGYDSDGWMMSVTSIKGDVKFSTNDHEGSIFVGTTMDEELDPMTDTMLIIFPGATLTIGERTTIKVGSNASIINYGTIKCIVSMETEEWNGSIVEAGGQIINRGNGAIVNAEG